MSGDTYTCQRCEKIVEMGHICPALEVSFYPAEFGFGRTPDNSAPLPIYKDGQKIHLPTVLDRIAIALERIANSLEKEQKPQ